MKSARIAGYAPFIASASICDMQLDESSLPIGRGAIDPLRQAIGFQNGYRYLIHDRACIFTAALDESIKRLGLAILKSPPRSPKQTRFVSE